MFTLALRHGRAETVTLYKNVVGALALGLAALLVPGWGGAGDPADVPWLLGSGVLGMALGDWLYFVALAHIGVGRTLVLTQITPVLTALAAWPVLGERMTGGQWIGAVLVVGGGVLAESRRVERGRADLVGVAAALTASVVWTLGNLSLHWGLDGTPPLTGGAWRLVGGTLGLLAVLAVRRRLGPGLRALTLPESHRRLLLPSLIGTAMGMACLAAGFKWALQGVAAALSAAVPVITIPLAVVVLHERPGWRGWLGAAVVVSGVALAGLSGG
jgi:DME family drug/metabolite transporter